MDLSRLPAASARKPQFAMGDDARLSNRLTGERMAADEVRWLGEKLRALLGEYAAHRPASRRPLSFADIERIWETDIQPKLSEFKSMQYADYTPPAEGSRWQLNYRIPSPLETR